MKKTLEDRSGITIDIDYEKNTVIFCTTITLLDENAMALAADALKSSTSYFIKETSLSFTMFRAIENMKDTSAEEILLTYSFFRDEVEKILGYR